MFLHLHVLCRNERGECVFLQGRLHAGLCLHAGLFPPDFFFFFFLASLEMESKVFQELCAGIFPACVHFSNRCHHVPLRIATQPPLLLLILNHSSAMQRCCKVEHKHRNASKHSISVSGQGSPGSGIGSPRGEAGLCPCFLGNSFTPPCSKFELTTSSTKMQTQGLQATRSVAALGQLPRQGGCVQFRWAQSYAKP